MSYIGANAQGIIASIDGGTISNATLDSSVTFPAGTVIGFKFVEIGNQALSGTYTKFNTTTAATSAQGLQVVSTTYDPKSNKVAGVSIWAIILEHL